MVLADLIQPGLRVVFCGTAVGARSAKVGAYYAGPGNAFWSTLHEIGLTPCQLRPSEYAELLRYGIGLTDICKRESGSDHQIGSGAFDVPRLLRTLDRYKPDLIAFNGKTAGKAAFRRPIGYGHQPDPIGPSRAYVLPSTSGAARGFWDMSYWRDLADAVASSR